MGVTNKIWGVAAALAAIAVASTFVRLFFGVDLTDECQYIAQALGPLIGGTPFVTDRLFQQSGSLLATPFLWIFTTATGSTDGIVMFYRFLYFSSGLATAFVLFKAMRRELSFAPSFCLAVLPLLYIPFSIPSFSYNTLAVLFTITNLSLWRIAQVDSNSIAAKTFPLTLALGIFSYPTLLVAYSVFLGLEWRHKEHRQLLKRTFIILVPLLVLAGAYVASIGLAEIEKNLEIARAVSFFTPEFRLLRSWSYLRMFSPDPIYWAVIAVITAILWFTRKPTGFAALPILAFSYLFFDRRTVVEVNFGYLLYGTTATLILLSIQKFRLKESWSINSEIATGIIMGFSMASSSSNGILNAALGFFVSSVFLIEKFIKSTGAIAVVAWLSAASMCCYSQWSYFYREARFDDLTTQIESGPFYGIVTSVSKAEYLAMAEADIKALPPSVKTIFVYDSFPAGYFFAFLRPITFLYYMHPTHLTPSLRPELVKFFDTDGARPDAIFETYAVPAEATSGFIVKSPTENKFDDPFWGYFANNPDYTPFALRTFYAIYVKNQR